MPVQGPYPSKADLAARRAAFRRGEMREAVENLADHGRTALLAEDQVCEMRNLSASELADDLVLLASAGTMHKGALYFDSRAIAERFDAQQSRAASAGQEDPEEIRWRADAVIEEMKRQGVDVGPLGGLDGAA